MGGKIKKRNKYNKQINMKKKIIFLAYSSSFGGGEIYLINLINYLADKHSIYLITSKEIGFIKNKIPKDVYYKSLSFGKILRLKNIISNINFLIYILKFIKKENIDIVQVNDLYSLFLFSIINIYLKKYLIAMNHSHYPPKYKFIYNYIFRKVNYNIFVSSWNRNNFEKVYKNIKKSKIIPIGFNFPIQLAKKYSNNIIHIGYICRYYSVKKINDYFHIAKYINSRYNNIQFYLIGGKEEDPDYYEVKNSCPSFIKCIDFTLDVENYYKLLDIYVSTSESESFGMTIIEAMSYGSPILSTDLPTIRQFVNSGENGFLFKIGDIKAACKYLELLINNANLRKKMGSNNIEKTKIYSINKVGLEYLKLYNDEM